MKNMLFTTIALYAFAVYGQLPYTENTFDFYVETDVEYGQATNFAGITDTLLMDIYKPIGDNNCNRPCLVLVHGGTWIAGSKSDPNMVNIAKSYAEKGWVVASINWRLGTHKTTTYNMYAFCNDDISAPCGYIADSAEVYRANYRGQQDTKGAIRFLKNRGILDSIDVNNVYLAGESAGAVVSYATAFMTSDAEKYPFCEAIADAPNPDADLVMCLPEGYSLERPDLGPVQGTLNLGENDASVQGVGGFYGAMLDFQMLDDEEDWPVMYYFHQGSDVIAHYNYGRILGRLDWECYTPTNLCQNYARYPKAFGSKGIENYLATLPDSPTRVSDIIENYEYTGDCFDNGHSIDNWIIRSNNMCNLFASRIADNGNTPNPGPCHIGIAQHDQIQVIIYPNPSTGTITFSNLNGRHYTIKIFNTQGQLKNELTTTTAIDIHLEKGLYLAEITTGDGKFTVKKVIIY